MGILGGNFKVIPQSVSQSKNSTRKFEHVHPRYETGIEGNLILLQAATSLKSHQS